MIARIGCAHCKKEFGTLEYSNYYKCTSDGCSTSLDGLFPGSFVCKSCRSAGQMACPSCKGALEFHDGDANARWAEKNGIMF